MTVCPTCGQPTRISVEAEAEKLFEALKLAPPSRDVYQANNARDGDDWFVTYRGGRFSEAAVRFLIAQSRVHSCYSNCPDDAYHIGRTLDVEASRRAQDEYPGRRQDAPKIYVET